MRSFCFSYATYKYSFLINYISNRRWKNELSLFQVFLYRFKKLRDEKLPHNNFKLMANISGLIHFRKYFPKIFCQYALEKYFNNK